MKVQHILAATDFSPTADAAVRRAALLAKAGGAMLDIVHSVYAPPLAEAWRKLVESEGITEDIVRAKAAERLATLAADIARRTGVTPTTHLLSGKPPLALAQWAKDNTTDLIVIGAHGERLLLDLFVGSTALKLLRLSAVPVLLVKRHPPFDYERILVATDFSPAAQGAANLAARFLPDANLYLFHAFEAPFERQMTYAGSDDEAVDRYRRLGETEARWQMEEFAKSLETPEKFVCKVRHGYAPALINQYAVDIGADLLVLGAQRQSEFAAALLGSVAVHLVNETRSDLLLVPHPD